MAENISATLVVPAELAAQRLDRVAVELLPQYSRARIQNWLKSGQLRLNGQPARAKDKVRIHDRLDLNAIVADEGEWDAQAIPLTIVYEDDHLLVINKPPDFVVHPAPGHTRNTVVNAVLHHCPALRQLPRAGIVHRLDKDTSGLMVIAKSLEAHHSLVRQLQDRSMGRQYEAIVWGELTGGGTVDAAIARCPRNRQKMAVVAGGKTAVTHYQLLKRFVGCSQLRLKLESGRTHQIRVHMTHIRHSIVGDLTYGHHSGRLKTLSTQARDAVLGFPRQALHARALSLIHPMTGAVKSWETELPDDMQALIAALEPIG